MITAALRMDIKSAIQQKVNNVILLPKAIEAYSSVSSKSSFVYSGSLGGLLGKKNGWREVGSLAVDKGRGV